jgi:hypothetical protein
MKGRRSSREVRGFDAAKQDVETLCTLDALGVREDIPFLPR